MQLAVDQAADPEAARMLARYFQVRPGGYGEGDTFAGVRLSTVRVLARPYRAVRFEPDVWRPVLRSPVHEHRLAALVVMADRARRGPAGERSAIYDTYRAHTGYVNNWDLVDASAAPIVGGHLRTRDRTPLAELARSPLVWERRIAIVATHELIRAGESAETYRLAEILLDDPHDLIHKAVGWMLREAGRRVDAAELRAFLDSHAPRMPRTMLRYAIEHLDPAVRADYRARR